MSIPYLIAAFGGLLLSNHLSVYSAGPDHDHPRHAGPAHRGRRLDVVVTFAGGIYFMLIAKDFYGPFITFLTLLAVPITAWVGVFAVDMMRASVTTTRVALMDIGRTQPLLVSGGGSAGRAAPPGWWRSWWGCCSPRPRPARPTLVRRAALRHLARHQRAGLGRDPRRGRGRVRAAAAWTARPCERPAPLPPTRRRRPAARRPGMSGPHERGWSCVGNVIVDLVHAGPRPARARWRRGRHATPN